jgi:hypothetical protein
VGLDFLCTAHSFFPDRSSNHCQGLRRTFPEICIKFGVDPLSDPLRNRIRPDTRLQLKGRKKSARPPIGVKFCILAIIYRRIALVSKQRSQRFHMDSDCNFQIIVNQQYSISYFITLLQQVIVVTVIQT